ncbi:hypothetical protein EJB05_03154, partial [Eragrostis curvula]
LAVAGDNGGRPSPWRTTTSCSGEHCTAVSTSSARCSSPCATACSRSRGCAGSRLTRVISHPLALAQCEQTLTDMMGLAVRRQRFSSTAGAAAYVAANGLRDTAAVASSRAAELYGMEVLADGNVTRFVVLARELVVPPRSTDDGRRPIKTSIVFAGASSSVLFEVLAAFAKRDISLTRIETRPKYHNVETRLLGRMFWYDFQASLADPRRAERHGRGPRVHLLPAGARELPHGHGRHLINLADVTLCVCPPERWMYAFLTCTQVNFFPAPIPTFVIQSSQSSPLSLA